MHAIYLPDLDPEALVLDVRGHERDHAAKSKRLREGDHALVLNGRGERLTCEISAVSPALRLQVLEREHIPRVTPIVEVWAPPPKGPRAGTMIDALSQAGAASWTPMNTAFAATEASGARIDRLERVAVEALKQSQRAWLLDLHDSADFEDALGQTSDARLVLADASGEAFAHESSDRVRLLVGPEGGWRADEVERARAAGASVCRFGPHVMRIEVAAPVAAAIVLSAASG